MLHFQRQKRTKSEWNEKRRIKALVVSCIEGKKCARKKQNKVKKISKKNLTQSSISMAMELVMG